MTKKKISIAIFLGLAFTLALAGAVYAQGTILPQAHGTAPVPAACAENAPAGVDPATYCGNYELNDFVRLGLNVSRWIMGIVGTLTLAMFIFAGQTLLLSAGSSEKIDKARKMMVAAVVGMFIVFGSYLLIKGVLASVGLNWDGSIKKPTAYTSSGGTNNQ